MEQRAHSLLVEMETTEALCNLTTTLLEVAEQVTLEVKVVQTTVVAAEAAQVSAKQAVSLHAR